MKFSIRAGMAIASFPLLCSLPAGATENAGITYPVGVDTVLNAILPAPGATQVFSYSQHYVANRFAGPDGHDAIPGFSVSALVEAPRFLHTWEAMLGPLTMTTGAVLPLVHVNTSIGALSANHGGLGDMIVHPLMLGYVDASHRFFAYASTDIALPTGAYSAARLANTGANTYALLPILSMTWFPAKNLEISASTVTEFHSRNKVTHYRSGKVSITDFNIGYSIDPAMQLGLQGYVLKQFTDDKIDGIAVAPDGFRGRALALGPQFRYNTGPKTGFVLKYQREFSVRNRPQGQRLWAEFTTALE